ncbi:MAG: hypothetical protein ACXVYY_01205 [Oryzihumus sp.]
MTDPGYEDDEHEAWVLNHETDDTWHAAFDASLRAQETARTLNRKEST